MEIYIADLRVLTGEKRLKALERQLPCERRRRIAGYRLQADKLRSMGAGLLLEYGLRKRGYTLCPEVSGRRLLQLEYGRYGKPYCPDAPKLCFNLSHAGDYAAAVFDTTAAGIDVEHDRRAKPAVAERFFTEAEYVYLQSADTVHETEKQLKFMWLWTRKESYIKAVGEGIHLPLHTFCVLSDIVAGDKGIYYLKSFRLQREGVLSVCAEHEIQAEPAAVDLAKAFDCGS